MSNERIVLPPKQPGLQFAKWVWALGRNADGTFGDLANDVARFRLDSPHIDSVAKSAVAAATTIDAGWASELAPYAGLVGDFIVEVTRLSLLGQIPGSRVPFLTKTIDETAPLSSAYVAPGDPIPFSKLSLAVATALQPKKYGVLVPFVRETFESATPANLEHLRRRLIAGAVYGADVTVLDPSFAATNARPQSLTNGVVPSQTTGSSAAQVIADFKACIQQQLDNGADPRNLVFALSPTTTLYCMQLLTAGGTYVFPELKLTGGNIWGVRVIVTSAAVQVGSPTTHLVALIDGSKILLADDGLIVADASSVAALQFTDSPAAGPTTQVSLFQSGARVIRLLRTLNFQRASNAAVSWFPVAY